MRGYIEVGNTANERDVAEALRPILEQFTRVAYPGAFPPGSVLGRRFFDQCQQRHGQPNEILSVDDTAELRLLVNYANTFHHDTNPAWETAHINDRELLGFATRTIAFASR